jgi:CBS domain-containing protein
MLVQQIMSQPVVFCYRTDSLDLAAQRMWEADCGALPIVDDSGRVVAMLTDRDICIAAYTQGKRLSEISVTSAMSRELAACAPDSTLEYAELLMRNYQIRRLPVLDEDNKLVGILSLNDLARAAARQHHYVNGGSNVLERLVSIARTVAAICAPSMRTTDPKVL